MVEEGRPLLASEVKFSETRSGSYGGLGNDTDRFEEVRGHHFCTCSHCILGLKAMSSFLVHCTCLAYTSIVFFILPKGGDTHQIFFTFHSFPFISFPPSFLCVFFFLFFFTSCLWLCRLFRYMRLNDLYPRSGF